MSCKNCIFHTTIETEISKTDWNNLAEAYNTFYMKVNKDACGYNPGNPVEIPNERVSCDKVKLKVQ
jgi:hypothetical protein